ncbi:hypothetical protein ACEPXE_22595 [Pseudomonas aeruginosa]
MNKANECTCPSGDGSLVHPCPAHPAVEQADVAAKLTFINGRPAMCGCQVEYSDGGGEYSDVIYVTLCAKHSGSAILDLVATNRIALTPEYEGQWHADLYLDREIPLAKVEGATPAEAVLALMSAERIDPEQESVEQAGGDEHVSLRGAANLAFNALHECVPAGGAEKQYSDAIRALETALRDIAYSVNRTATPQQFSDHLQREARAALAQPSPAQAEQAEAERPEMSPERAAYFMRRFKSEEKLLGPNEQAAVDYVLSLLAQHDRIVGELRAEIAEWQEAAGRSRSDVVAYIAERAKLLEERDAALANVDALAVQVLKLGGTISFAHHRTDQAGQVPQAWLDVQAERRRQITAEGWTPEHDDEHDSGELAAAGAAYALHAADHLNPYSQGDGGDEAPSCWPWHDGIAGRGEGPEKTEPAWWKPTTPRRDLVKACALALAEIERLDRAGISQSPQPGATTASS